MYSQMFVVHYLDLIACYTDLNLYHSLTVKEVIKLKSALKEHQSPICIDLQRSYYSIFSSSSW
jgi:hypothetical protein